jgi:penicillin-insensitive murein endopeptidase
MAQPNPGGVHDDHLHVRTACSPAESATGCEGIGPRRPWLTYDQPRIEEDDRSLALALFQPLREENREERRAGDQTQQASFSPPLPVPHSPKASARSATAAP